MTFGDETAANALAHAAELALHAPSVFNTQPWRWRLEAPILELYADHDRQLRIDPVGRLLTVSCGAALHHARVALAAAGYAAAVQRFPDPGRPDLIARMYAALPHRPSPAELSLAAAISLRRTDRRAYANEPLPTHVVARLLAAAQVQGAGLHIVRGDQMPMFAVAAARAGDLELKDPEYRNELIRWTNRPPWSDDGVPPATAVQPGIRRVPVRDFTLGPDDGMEIGPGMDRGAVYAVVFGDQDEPGAWLRSGEALSAVLLTATAEDLSTSPISDVIEVGAARELIRGLLSSGHPHIAVRIGRAVGGDEPPASPRRQPGDVIDTSS